MILFKLNLIEKLLEDILIFMRLLKRMNKKPKRERK